MSHIYNYIYVCDKVYLRKSIDNSRDLPENYIIS